MGWPATYGHDALTRLNGLTYNGQTPNYTFGYDALSRRNLLTRPNGIATSYGYDLALNLLSVLHKLGTTVLDGATYTVDSVGNPIKVHSIRGVAGFCMGGWPTLPS